MFHKHGNHIFFLGLENPPPRSLERFVNDTKRQLLFLRGIGKRKLIFFLRLISVSIRYHKNRLKKSGKPDLQC